MARLSIFASRRRPSKPTGGRSARELALIARLPKWARDAIENTEPVANPDDPRLAGEVAEARRTIRGIFAGVKWVSPSDPSKEQQAAQAAGENRLAKIRAKAAAEREAGDKRSRQSRKPAKAKPADKPKPKPPRRPRPQANIVHAADPDVRSRAKEGATIFYPVETLRGRW